MILKKKKKILVVRSVTSRKIYSFFPPKNKSCSVSVFLVPLLLAAQTANGKQNETKENVQIYNVKTEGQRWEASEKRRRQGLDDEL